MKLSHGALIMVIDGEKMLFLRNEGDRKYAVLETLARDDLDNPPSREQGRGAPGRTFARTGDERSAYEGTDWHSLAEERFARLGAARFERLAADHTGALIVIAPPRTLGVLRKYRSPAIRDRVVAEIGKDMVHRETDDIAAAIAAHAHSHEKPERKAR